MRLCKSTPRRGSSHIPNWQFSLTPPAQTRTQVTIPGPCSGSSRPERSRICQSLHSNPDLPHPPSPIFKLHPRHPTQSRRDLPSRYQGRRRRRYRPQSPQRSCDSHCEMLLHTRAPRPTGWILGNPIFGKESAAIRSARRGRGCPHG